VDECLWHRGTRIELTPKVFAVLLYLVGHAGRLVRQGELLEALWPGIYVQPEILKTYVRDIRKALGDDPRAPKFVETRARHGYRFIAEVRDGTPPSPSSPAASSHGTHRGPETVDLSVLVSTLRDQGIRKAADCRTAAAAAVLWVPSPHTAISVEKAERPVLAHRRSSAGCPNTSSRVS
jgi:DNA-binding winged helix-turn-helix (wHTH) protein